MGKINLFVDMDGTVAKFYYKKNYLEKMYEQGYFKNLPKYAIAKQIDLLASQNNDIEVYILSACIKSPHCKGEKIAWLQKYMPNIDDNHIILCEVGENKLVKAKNLLKENFTNATNILLDDYTQNLIKWEVESNTKAIKFVNGINCKGGKWQGVKVKTYKQLCEELNKY